MKTINQIREASQAKWVITVKQKFNGLKLKDSVEVVARGTTEALKKGAKKLGVPEAWKHAGVLDVNKLSEGTESLDEVKGDKAAYQVFFNKTLKKYGAESPESLSDADKKKFYDEIDAGWEGDNEED
jgi:hypothetical protein